MNSINLIGNLTRDVEIRYLQSGTAIANTGIAINKKRKRQDGSIIEKVMFIDIKAFGRQAEVMNQYLRKGSKIGIVAELEFEQWTAQDGSKRSKHSLIINHLDMLDPKPETGATQQRPQYAAPQQQQSTYAPQQPQQQQQQQQQYYQQSAGTSGTPSTVPEVDVEDDEIPF